MIKKIISAIFIAAVAFAFTGCGDDKREEKSVAKDPKITIADQMKQRKEIFTRKIALLKSFGLDVNQTVDTDEKTVYDITVTDANLATSTLLYALDLGTTMPRDRKEVAKLIGNLKRFGLEADWKKYAQNAPKSIFVWLKGSGKEESVARKLMAEKKLAAYLSYDAKDLLKRVDIQDINEKIEDATIVFKNAYVGIDKLPAGSDTGKKLAFHFGTLNFGVEENGTKVFSYSYENPVCKVEKSNPYLGTWQCTFPAMEIGGGKGMDAFTVFLKDNTLDYVVTAHDKKIKGDATLHTGSVTWKGGKSESTFSGAVKDIKLHGVTDGVSEKIMQEMYALASTPQKDLNKTAEKVMKLVGDMFDDNLTASYQFSIASVEGQSLDNNETMAFSMNALSEEGKYLLGKTIEVDDVLKIKEIKLHDGKGGKPLFALQGFTFGQKLRDFYNPFPEFMRFAGALAQHDPASGIPEKEKERLGQLGTTIVNHGLSLTYSPVSVESLILNKQPVALDTKKVQLDVAATLQKNDIKFDNPAASMMLLQHLSVDGKLVLGKSDLDALSKVFPPQVMGMVMMYAKYDGDKAVFVLKFEKGHLQVNDKPVM